MAKIGDTSNVSSMVGVTATRVRVTTECDYLPQWSDHHGDTAINVLRRLASQLARLLFGYGLACKASLWLWSTNVRFTEGSRLNVLLFGNGGG
jgi:hypothetical protein